ncbi:flavin-containing monooxygenase FMO GS-OX4-like [Rana temporaria]|uniref:flavin-containing monooxygenase FMO GS-OX4-like n=1 Tax=Rana temporaria TaxID=8407 RepID=UPI001AAE05E4|nr:flavin-containing monooxygenase FMO GS-OX4-like [Rana temporaria]
MASGRLRVAVIGAGAAGLCSARHILSRPLTFEPPVVLEMTEQVGGTWVYTEEVESGAHIHSSMYRDLSTNLPKEIMEFPDFAFDPSLPSFIHHSEVLKYLEDYTDRFSIRPHIKFNTRVVSVTPVLGEGKNSEVSWDVTSQTQDNGDPVTERFDAIMVCAGHYSHPFLPDIEGLEQFQGQVLHSKYYRYPEVFSFHSVVVLGAGPSGLDISLELSPHAKHVSLSHQGSPLQWTPPANLSFVPPVVRATHNSLICEDGTEIMADTLIFCTGYKYTYPFLLTGSNMMENQKIDQRDKMKRKNLDELIELESGKGFKKNEENPQVNETLTVKSVLPRVDLLEDEDIVGTNGEQGHLPPLYKHLFHARYPTLGFIGAVKFVIPFSLFHCQAQFFLSVLGGKFQLPPPEEMLSESREEVLKTQNSGIPLKYLHRLGKNYWEYMQGLADTAGFEPLAPVLCKIFQACWNFKNIEPTLYRRLNFKLLNREEYEMKGEVPLPFLNAFKKSLP